MKKKLNKMLTSVLFLLFFSLTFTPFKKEDTVERDREVKKAPIRDFNSLPFFIYFVFFARVY